MPLLLLLAKLFIAPTFVVVVTLIGRRSGPSVAGLLAALPVIGGPILGLIVAEQGARFGTHAAFGGAIGAASTMLFALVYAHVASRVGALASLVLAYATFFLATYGASLVPANLFTAIVIPAIVWAISMRAFPNVHVAKLRVAQAKWDLPVRALVTMTLVLAVTGLARSLGPKLAGLITPIPIITAVLAVFTHRESGADASAVLLRSLVRGLASFTSFFVIVGVALPHVHAALAFLLAIAFALALQFVVVRFEIALPPAPLTS